MLLQRQYLRGIKVKVATSKQMRKIDSEASSMYGIPGIVFMENASIKVAKHVISIDDIENKKVCIICGVGNNGGDGFGAARHLVSVAESITIYFIGSVERLKGDALTNYNIAKNMGLYIRGIDTPGDILNIKDDISGFDVIIDGLLGTGVRGEVTGIYKDVIDIINSSNAYVISIDIPSGVDADTGMVMGCAVRADKTVTFALPKIGLYTYPGAQFSGEVVLEDISIPKKLIEAQDINVKLLTYEDIKLLFPERRRDTNKGTYGRAYIVGGSESMMGAVTLSALSALRCGAGLVELGVPYCIKGSVAPLVMEAIVNGLEDEDGIVSYGSRGQLIRSLKRASAFAIGPGLSKSSGLLKLLEEVILEAEVSGVIDADGLNLLSQDVDLLLKSKNTLIVTPHPGEMSSLTGMSVREIQSDRIGCARDFSLKYGVVTVLKGANTVIASPEGEVFINVTGNPGMAKGGSGDVLTGMIVSFLAQGIKPYDAAKAGVYIHGLAGDMASYEMGKYSMKAGDIIDYIPRAMKRV